MRPLHLTLQGFRSHEKKAEIDFTGRTLVAITGPTGAGKSSILDAIAYALYSKTPRLKKGQKRLICSRGDSARVKLTFSVEKVEYEVTRVLRKKGTGEHLFVDLSSGEKTTGEQAVTEKVEELLGLDFDGFSSSVLLAQGKFSQFLEATPSQQVSILKGVFRLDEIDSLREVAKSRGGDLQLSLAEVDGALSQIPDDIPGRLKEAGAATERLAAREKELSAALKEERSLVERARGAAEALERAEAEQRSLARALDELPSEDDLTDLSEAAVRGTAARLAAGKAYEEAVAAAEEAEAEARRLRDEVGTPEDLATFTAEVKALTDAASELAGVESERSAAVKAAEEEAKSSEELSAALEAAEAALDAARADRSALEDAHRAHVLREHLAPGQACPVCEQTVATVPGGKPPAALSDAKEAEKVAVDRVAAARKAAETARAEVAGARKHVEGLEAHAARCAAREQEARRRLLEGLGEVDDFAAEVERRRTVLGAAQGRSDKARAAIAMAGTAREAAEKEAAGVAERVRRTAGAVIRVAGTLGAEAPGVDDDALSLLEHVRALGRDAAGRLAETEKLAAESAGAAGELEAKIASLREGLGLEDAVPVEDALAQVREEAAGIKSQMKMLDEFAVQAKELGARKKALSAEKSLYTELVADLAESRFIKFLLEDRRRLLSELGSAQLQALTGRYRFDDDAEFNVVDMLDADKVRDVETLSGGELFLASLSLALGLADTVARHGGRLQSFFLDEGFGSLDPESLDLALDGIEHVVQEDRLVGLVSHVPALAARVEDEIRLERDPEGMSVIVDGAG